MTVREHSICTFCHVCMGRRHGVHMGEVNVFYVPAFKRCAGKGELNLANHRRVQDIAEEQNKVRWQMGNEYHQVSILLCVLKMKPSIEKTLST